MKRNWPLPGAWINLCINLWTKDKCVAQVQVGRLMYWVELLIIFSVN